VLVTRYVSVQDVALAHIRAAEISSARGRYFLAASEQSLPGSQLLQILQVGPDRLCCGGCSNIMHRGCGVQADHLGLCNADIQEAFRQIKSLAKGEPGERIRKIDISKVCTCRCSGSSQSMCTWEREKGRTFMVASGSAAVAGAGHQAYVRGIGLGGHGAHSDCPGCCKAHIQRRISQSWYAAR
jgi:hypothetical protein